jgi:multidrug efflux system membrane fusion protein
MISSGESDLWSQWTPVPKKEFEPLASDLTPVPKERDPSASDSIPHKRESDPSVRIVEISPASTSSSILPLVPRVLSSQERIIEERSEDDITVIIPVQRLLAAGVVRPPPLNRGRAAALASVVLIGVAGLAIWARGYQAGATASDKLPDNVTSVVALRIERRDVPLYLEGLGSVTPINTVTIKSQVDGRIVNMPFQEGQIVHQGDLLVEIDPRPLQNALRRAEGQLARDRAQLRNARLNLSRYKVLREQHLVAQQQVDDQQAQLEQYQGTITFDRAQIEDAKLQLTFALITSPITGRTGVRLVDPGNVVHANDPNGIVIITQVDPISVLFSLPEDELPKVQAVLSGGKLRVEAWSRDGQALVGTGELALIDNQINQATGTFRLKALFENADEKLWPNQFVKTKLLVKTVKDAIVVPPTVLQRGPNGTFVYVIENDKAAMRPVEIEGPSGELTVVSHGLNAGEWVVAEGQHRLASGSKVRVQNATENGTQTATASPSAHTGKRPRSSASR